MEVGAKLLEELTSLVSKAAGEILSARSRTLVARTKSDESPVTAADEIAEAIIVDGLASLLPGIPILSEEAVYRSGCGQAGGDFVLVDPIDGTKELLAGRDEFAINLALIRGGLPEIGIVAAPALGLVWRTAAVLGAERLRLPAGSPAAAACDCTPIHTRPFPSATPVAAVSRSHLDTRTEAFLAEFPGIQLLRAGSALKLCWVAEGSADVYPRLAPTREWDVAAGDAILRRAGGIVNGPDWKPLSYGNFAEGLIVKSFIAWGDPSAAKLHKA